MSMTKKKIIEALTKCAEIAREAEPNAIRAKVDETCIPNAWGAMGHLLVITEEAKDLLEEGRREKVMRWLGFIQGVLWALGYATLKELKEMNMPDPEDQEATP